MNSASQLRRRLSRAVKLALLAREANPAARALARGIRDALRAHVDPQDESAMERIENLRAMLHQSSRPLERTDFGAGPTGDQPADARRVVATTVGEFSRSAGKSRPWCRLLFSILRQLRPRSCLEMGTAVGVSAAYQASALQRNRTGTLVTLEGDPHLAEIARENLQTLHLSDVRVVTGRFQETLDAELQRLRPVEWVFVDGHHDEAATLAYFELALGALATTAVMLFDDITWSEGMKRAWHRIAGDRRVALALDFGPLGACVIGGPGCRRRFVSLPLPW